VNGLLRRTHEKGPRTGFAGLFDAVPKGGFSTASGGGALRLDGRKGQDDQAEHGFFRFEPRRRSTPPTALI
jgi:hypothetical protein